MGLLDIFKKKVLNTNERELDKDFLREGCGNGYKYILLWEKCVNLYSLLTRYEFCLCGVDSILFDKKMYDNTKDEMFLDSMEKKKHNIFIQKSHIKDLISCAKNEYQLDKDGFVLALQEIFGAIATNREYPAEFCIDYFVKTLSHIVYDDKDKKDFAKIFDAFLVQKFGREIEDGLRDFKENLCPYCQAKQSTSFQRSQKCEKCGHKIWIVKISSQKIGCVEAVHKKIFEVQSNIKQHLDFFYMALSTGCKVEELEKILLSGDLNDIKNIAWTKLSKKRNEYYSQGQIDLLSKINLGMAKILIAEEKYETALVFICEAIYCDYSPISYHPHFACHQVNHQIKNVDENDTIRYNETHKSMWNESAISLLRDVKKHLEKDFDVLLRKSFEECTHFYLSMSAEEIYCELKKVL